DNDRFPVQRLEIEEHTAELADMVIAECPQDKDDLINLYHVDPAKITIVPCGFCPSEFFPVNRFHARSKLGLGQNEHIILQLGRMVPRKGVDTVIKALPFLKCQGLNVKLLIVGGETEVADPELYPEIGRLKKIAEDEKVLSSICFEGRKNRNILKY